MSNTISKNGFLQYSSANVSALTISGDINLDSIDLRAGNDMLNSVSVAASATGLTGGSLALSIQVSTDNTNFMNLSDAGSLTLTASVTSGTIDFVTNFPYFRVVVDDTGAEGPALTAMYMARRVDAQHKLTVDMASGSYTNVTTSGSATVGGILGVTGASTFTGAISGAAGATIAGTITGSSDLTVTGGITGSSDLDITGGITGSSDLDITGGITGSSDLDITGGITGSSNLDLTGALTLSSEFKMPMVAGSSSVTLPGYGIVTIASTKDIQYTLTNPTSRSFLTILSTSSYNKAVVCASSADCCFGDASSSYKLNFDAVGEAVILVGKSTAAWAIASNNGSVSLVTT